jgi:hypothetical protein
MSIPDDISPSSLPFTTRMREYLNASGNSGPHPEVAHTVFEYVDIAKRMLLELRVRDFTAGDVVALAGIMESRDRDHFKSCRTDEEV